MPYIYSEEIRHLLTRVCQKQTRFIGLVKDPRTKPFFDNNKQSFIKAILFEQMCELMTGRCKYPGRDMKSSYANMKVNSEALMP